MKVCQSGLFRRRKACPSDLLRSLFHHVNRGLCLFQMKVCQSGHDLFQMMVCRHGLFHRKACPSDLLKNLFHHGNHDHGRNLFHRVNHGPCHRKVCQNGHVRMKSVCHDLHRNLFHHGDIGRRLNDGHPVCRNSYRVQERHHLPSIHSVRRYHHPLLLPRHHQKQYSNPHL